MANLLDTGAAFLASQLKAQASTTATYQRGGASLSISIVKGRTFMRLGDSVGGTRVEITDLDILFTAADLILDGAVTRPEKADRVLIPSATAGMADVYEVRAPQGEQLWRWSDPTHYLIRCHLKWVGEELAA